jgi:hypothetical protein
MKNLGIRDKTYRIRNTGIYNREGVFNWGKNQATLEDNPDILQDVL